MHFMICMAQKERMCSDMGLYLDSSRAFSLYSSEAAKDYFVDKSKLLEELIPLVQTGGNYICVTRPRRFGKTVMANMIGAFFGKGSDSRSLFDKLAIAGSPFYLECLNQYHVIYVTFNELPRAEQTYDAYIGRIESRILKDLVRAYPDCGIGMDEALWDALNEIFEAHGERFVFVFDEWDFIFHREFVDERGKQRFISFLNNLLKDQPYVRMAYMTGILPIAKYSSGSELNMFKEYTMSTQHKFGDYFGFTETEVDRIYQCYLEKTEQPRVTREGLRLWYDGYHTLSGECLYNPRSVVFALENNQLADSQYSK